MFEVQHVSLHCEELERQVELVPRKSSLTTDALREGVKGTEVTLIQRDSQSILACGQPLLCFVLALFPG